MKMKRDGERGRKKEEGRGRRRGWLTSAAASTSPQAEELWRSSLSQAPSRVLIGCHESPPVAGWVRGGFRWHSRHCLEWFCCFCRTGASLSVAVAPHPWTIVHRDLVGLVSSLAYRSRSLSCLTLDLDVSMFMTLIEEQRRGWVNNNFAPNLVCPRYQSVSHNMCALLELIVNKRVDGG